MSTVEESDIIAGLHTRLMLDEYVVNIKKMPSPETDSSDTQSRKRLLEVVESGNVLSNETPVSFKSSCGRRSQALFSCSTPLSTYKTPAKKKRLFTPQRGGDSSGCVPVSSPTASELLNVDTDNSYMFLNASCCQSIPSSDQESDVLDVSDCTPLKTIILNNSDCVIDCDSAQARRELDENLNETSLSENAASVSGIDFL